MKHRSFETSTGSVTNIAPEGSKTIQLGDVEGDLSFGPDGITLNGRPLDQDTYGDPSDFTDESKEGVDDGNALESDFDDRDPYNPEEFRAPQETLKDMGDTAAIALGGPGSEYASPTEKLAAVLAAIEAEDGTGDDDYYDDEPAKPEATISYASGNDRIAMQIGGKAYDANGNEINPRSTSGFQVTYGPSRRGNYSPEALEKLRAAVKKMEDHGDQSDAVR